MKIFSQSIILLMLSIAAWTGSVSHASWESLNSPQSGKRYVILEGLKHDLINTGDTVLVHDIGGIRLRQEVVFVMFTHGKTILVFKDPFPQNLQKPKISIIDRGPYSQRASNQLSQLGFGYSDRSLKKPTRSGSHKLWIGEKLYRVLKTGDEIEITKGAISLKNTVKHLVVHQGATLILLEEPLDRELTSPQITKVFDANESDVIDNSRTSIADSRTGDNSNTTNRYSSTGSQQNTASSNSSNSGVIPTPPPQIATPPDNVSIQDLVITRTDTFTDNSDLVAGVNDASVLKFEIHNPNNFYAEINSVQISMYGTDAAGQNAESISVQLFKDGVQQGTSTVVVGNDTNFTIPNLRTYLLPKTTAKFEIVVDTTVALSNNNNIDDTFLFRITDVLASAGEKSVNVNHGSTQIAKSPINGATFKVTSGGYLTAELGSTVFSDILVANQQSSEILNIRLSAKKDEVVITDVILEINDPSAGDRATFALFNESGVQRANAQAINGKIHFELVSPYYIQVPKDGSTSISVVANIKDINDVNQTGKKLSIKLQSLEAVSGATGFPLPESALNMGFIKSNEFLILNSKLSIHHATTQPAFADPSATEQEFYRFTVTSSADKAVALSQVKLRLDLQGMQFSQKPEYRILQIKADGTLDRVINITQSVMGEASSGKSDTITIRFNNQIIPAGSSRTFALLFNNTQNSTLSTENDDDSVAVAILTDLVAKGPTAETPLRNNSNLVWSDQSGTDSYFSGYLLNIEPTTLVNQD